MMFRLAQGRPRVLRTALTVSAVTVQGDIVRDEDGLQHRLTSLLGDGGEGKVFLTNTGLACKLYDSARLTEELKAKLQLMRTAQFARKGLCWPKSLASNKRGEFVGYLMDQARGKEIQKSVFIKPLLLQHFPGWDRRNLVDLTISILEIIQFLHSKNVLLGDINPRNILADNLGNVFFVDTDSYQIEDFACPVGTATFLAPELAGRQLSEVLRTLEHENFAVSTLVFMLLMPGKPPFSHAGGTDPAQNVLKRHFPYNLGEERGVNVPAGPWRYIWSNFPFYLKKQFYHIFKYGDPCPRVLDWLFLLKRYRNDLADGRISTTEIFPTRLKQLNQQQVEEKGGKWLRCVNKECRNQNGGFYGEFKHHGPDVVRLCPECRQMVWRRVRCVESGCPHEFAITLGEKFSYEKRGQEIPKRCKACREKRKQRSHY
jgi:DNA-binding helix-hairpin-helix protein with protein kinase domain